MQERHTQPWADTVTYRHQIGSQNQKSVWCTPAPRLFVSGIIFFSIWSGSYFVRWNISISNLSFTFFLSDLIMLPPPLTFLGVTPTNHFLSTVIIVSYCSQLPQCRSNGRSDKLQGSQSLLAPHGAAACLSVPLPFSNLPLLLASKFNVRAAGSNPKLSSWLKSVKCRFTKVIASVSRV